MRGLLTITGKDLRQRLRDRSAYIFGIVVPLGLAVLFSLIAPGLDEEGLSLDVAVVDRDGGQLAAAFRDGLGATEVVGEVTHLQDAEAARRAVDGGDVDAAYVLPEGFTAAGTSGGPVRVEVVVDPDRALQRLVATSIAKAFAQHLDTAATAVSMVATASGGQVDQGTLTRTAQLAASRGPAVELDQGVAEDDRLDATTYLAAGMAVFFLFFTVQFGVLSLLEERENGTLDRLRVAPIRRGTILAAKVVTSVVLGLVSMSVLVAATTVLLDARWGDPLGVALLVLCGVLAASATVALVGSLARTAEQASTWQAIIAIVLGMLGGSFFPLNDAPGWLHQLRKASPHHWFLEGLGQLTGGGGPSEALPAASFLLVFAAAVAFVAAVAGRRSRA